MSNSQLTLLPAIDVSDGRAVRLVQGELSAQTNYGSPLDAAADFLETFTKFPKAEHWVHLVDLDAAFGRGDNRELLADVVAKLCDQGVNVELSGGIREDADLHWALETGAQRVNIGTAALENPDWTRDILSDDSGNKIAIGLDVRGETLAGRGWVNEGGNLWETLERLLHQGCTRVVVTDVLRDGTLTGPNLELLEQISAFAKDHLDEEDLAAFHVQASGGVAELADLKAIKELQTSTKGVVDSVIVGKALYAGRFTLSEAFKVAA